MEDLEAREAFVRGAYPGLFRWFRRLSGSTDLAGDLAQDTFAAFWASAGRARADVSPRTWLYAIGRNLWRKRMRDRKSHGPAGLDHVEGRGRPAEEGVDGREFREAADRAVAALPADLREAFLLRFWDEFDYDEIAEIQGISAGLARWRYFAARRRLHELLAPWDPSRGRAGEDHHVR